MTIDDLIQFEPEGTALDFKATQYTKDQHEDLLKDVLAMANADVEGERRIILGVKDSPGAKRTVVGIGQDDFVDPATYQQLVHSNIEPDLIIDYVPHQYGDKHVGVLSIRGCDDQPYLLKKKYRSLREGTGLIRKGTHQRPLMRADLDRMAKRRSAEAAFVGEVTVRFRGSSSTTANVPAAPSRALPSEEAADRIKAILEEREAIKTRDSPFGYAVLGTIQYPNPFGPTPYERLPTEKLLAALDRVTEDYRRADLYDMYEERSWKANLEITNHGNRYVEDASIQLDIPRMPGVLVADRVHYSPHEESNRHFTMPGDPQYPSVVAENEFYVVTEDLGNIRHQRPTLAFGVDLRLVVDESLIGSSVSVRYSTFGRNLPTPISGELQLVVVGSAGQAA